MAWAPPRNVGDRDPAITDAKRVLRRYSYGSGLDGSDEYSVEFGVALIEFQTRRNLQILRGQVRDMPGIPTLGELSWATKKNLGILPEQQQAKPDHRPVIFTINGHLGGLFDGPAYLTARVLEEQGRVRVQPVGYDNVRKPFNNASGFTEIGNLINALPASTPWAILSHSQGSVIECDFYEQVIAPNRNRWPYSHYRGGVRFGNPRRPMNTVAPWIADPPPRGSEGLDPHCLTEPTPGVAEASRDGDLYANKTPGDAADWKEAVYMAVCRGKFFGANTLSAELGQLAMRFGNPAEILALFQAIVSGVVGLINLREHGTFDLRPCIDHVARTLEI